MLLASQTHMGNLPQKTPHPELKSLLANVSHELRTPLSGIIGYSMLLLKEPHSTEQHQGLMIIKASGEHLLGLINNLLDFAKLEAGKLELSVQPTELRECIAQLLGQLKPKAERNIKLTQHIAADVPPFILADEYRLRQVLRFLLDNALKFTNEGEVTIEVTMKAPAPEAGLTLQFTVRDTGIGIPPDQLVAFFAPFSQEASAARKHGGLGLGRQLVELMGGILWAESDGVQGHGTAFHFTLPTQACDPAPEEATEPKPPEFSAPEFAINHPLNILVVDSFSGFVAQPLKQLGYAVDSVENGLEALGLWQQQAYDVVFINVHLQSFYSHTRRHKVLTGLETARRLREVHALFHPQPYLIALHNPLDTETNREECLAAGMHEYLHPFVKNPELKIALEKAWQALPPASA